MIREQKTLPVRKLPLKMNKLQTYTRQTRVKKTKRFCRGYTGGKTSVFSKRSPLAAGGTFLLSLAVALVFLAGCSVNHIKLARDLQRNHYYEEALDQYFKALKAKPDRIDLKIDLDRLLKEASAYYFYLGKEQEKAGDKEKTAVYYKKSLDFDPGNNEARKALHELTASTQNLETMDIIKKEMEINLGLPEFLKKSEHLNLEFRKKTGLMSIFEVLSKVGDVNILFDSAFKDRKVTLKLLDVTFHQALERICTLFNCRYYILDSKTIIIANPGTESDKRYKKLLIKNIFFFNAEVGEAKKIIESMFRPQRLIVNHLTNSLMVTDSIENIALVEKLARFIDKRRGEVEIEVEIMEVDRKKLEEYGSELSTWGIGAEIEGADQGIRLNDLYYLGSDDIKLAMPQVMWKFFSSITDSKILARPKIRGLDQKKINIQLGEKRPIPRTTFVPVSSGGVNQQPITSYDMTDVGIAVSITPTLHNNREVTLRLKFELTYVTDTGGTYVPPTLGNRTVETELRLRDNETGIIAGLMRGASSGSKTGIPILNRIPIIKELFSSTGKTNERTDILISITPRIIRMPHITAADLDPYYIGTQEKVELQKWKSE
jgi:general secretion pathway protein D